MLGGGKSKAALGFARGTPAAGVAGAASEAPPRGKRNDRCESNVNGGAENRAGLNTKARPYNGNGESQKRRLAALRGAQDKPALRDSR